ncbi:TPR repeat region protein [Toxoplasma gondii VAND]|uniref:TPR repeat region protein n=1 Tax=Toxoplasma gondii VAND TaxID=933077 RepID=A0A086PJX5_TOXGO|nr:TPR repeat region protein [Toxoplasma gondii VAND]
MFLPCSHLSDALCLVRRSRGVSLRSSLRLLYRSSVSFAGRRCGFPSLQEVEELEKILAAENVVLFDCLVGKDWKRAPAPPEFGHLSQWRKLSAFVEARLPPPHSAGPQTETRGDLSAD